MYVDAPVLGTKKPAEDGALVVLASGPEEVRDRIAPVLDAIGVPHPCGSARPGQGSRLKLVANSWVLTVLEGIAEALTFAKALDLDPRQFLDAVEGGAMDAPYVQLKGNAMLAGSFDPAFALDGAAKDAALMRRRRAGRRGRRRDRRGGAALPRRARRRPATATRTWPPPTSRTDPATRADDPG